jgi:hypothetical protein
MRRLTAIGTAALGTPAESDPAFSPADRNRR